MRDVTTFILAGGKSSRMGQNKAFLKLGKRVLVDIAINHARALGGDIFIVGPKAEFSAYGRTIADVYPHTGPLGGIHAALQRCESEYALILAVDTPFVRSEYLIALVDEALKHGKVATISRTADGVHPLCAVYHRRFRTIAEDALKAGDYKIDALFKPETTQYVDVQALGYDPGMMENLNTPKEFERAAKIVERDGTAGKRNR